MWTDKAESTVLSACSRMFWETDYSLIIPGINFLVPRENGCYGSLLWAHQMKGSLLSKQPSLLSLLCGGGGGGTDEFVVVRWKPMVNPHREGYEWWPWTFNGWCWMPITDVPSFILPRTELFSWMMLLLAWYGQRHAINMGLKLPVKSRTPSQIQLQAHLWSHLLGDEETEPTQLQRPIGEPVN